MMALDKAQEYLARRRVHEVADWGSMELDDEGKALQAEMEERQTASSQIPQDQTQLLTIIASSYRSDLQSQC